MPSAGAIPNSVANICLSAPASLEAGCKTVIGSRLKQSGMFWTVRGANAIVALRCCHLDGRFEDYGEARRAA